MPARPNDTPKNAAGSAPLVRKMDAPAINAIVRAGLAQDWSPEQIEGRLKQQQVDQPGGCVSAQTIYRNQMAYKLVPRFLTETFGEHDKDWETKKQPKKDGSGGMTAWVYVK